MKSGKSSGNERFLKQSKRLIDFDVLASFFLKAVSINFQGCAFFQQENVVDVRF